MNLFSQLNRIKGIMLESDSNIKVLKSKKDDGTFISVGDNKFNFGNCQLVDFNQAANTEPYFSILNTDNFNQDNSYYLQDLEILPQFRGKGYSHKLLDSCEQECKENKKQFILIIVDNDNSVANNLYKDRGFVKCDEKGNKSLHYFKVS
jgi:ribosomal protein S18 acetylase RimI-like enzyme